MKVRITREQINKAVEGTTYVQTVASGSMAHFKFPEWIELEAESIEEPEEPKECKHPVDCHDCHMRLNKELQERINQRYEELKQPKELKRLYDYSQPNPFYEHVNWYNQELDQIYQALNELRGKE